jgi:hypothetical protein
MAKPDDCKNCMALISARNYIRILEGTIDADQEKAIRHENKIFKLMALVYKLEIRVAKQRNCIHDLTVLLNRIEGQKTYMKWDKDDEQD